MEEATGDRWPGAGSDGGRGSHFAAARGPAPGRRTQLVGVGTSTRSYLPVRRSLQFGIIRRLPYWGNAPDSWLSFAKTSVSVLWPFSVSTILTASRTGEARGATWPEIPTSAQFWTVPATRMKGARPHRVPLFSPLHCDPCEPAAIFAARTTCSPVPDKASRFSNMALLELMRGLRPGFVPHGFRSTFKDWATETTDHARDIVEAALAHAVGDKVGSCLSARGCAAEAARAHGRLGAILRSADPCLVGTRAPDMKRLVARCLDRIGGVN